MKTNIKLGISVMLAAMLLVSMAFVSAASAQAAKRAEEVPIDVARDIATSQVQYAAMQKMVAGWDGAHIGNFEKRYTSDGELTAYDFKVEKGGKIIGQILVNALKHGDAVVALSANDRYTQGMTNYLPFFQLTDIYARENNVTLIKDVKQKYWENTKTKLFKNKDSGVSIQSISKILGVSHIWWDDGCTPSAGAMVLTYYGQHGYPSLNYGNNNDASDSGDGNGMDGAVNDYTEELHNSMGTDSNGGTIWTNADSGLITTVNAHKGSEVHWFSASDITMYPTFFEWYKSKMNQSKPVILHTSTGNTRLPDRHSVASDGYYEDPTQKYYYVQDPNEQYSYLAAVNSAQLAGATSTDIG